MQRSDVDIFCLQEVWQASVQRKIRNDLKAFYPYALSAIDLSGRGSDTLACGDSDAECLHAGTALFRSVWTTIGILWHSQVNNISLIWTRLEESLVSEITGVVI